MKTWKDRVNTELRAYLRWLQVMERVRPPHLARLSRTYKGELVTLYTRVGSADALQNAPVICLANITVVREHRGQGFLAALLERLDCQRDLLHAEWITVESVHNPGLARKLDTLGFSRFKLSEGSAPSFFRKLPGREAPPIAAGQ